MSFWVKVPVLSVIRNCTRPSSSGIEEFLAMAPEMPSWSVLMQWQYHSLARSRLIRRELGIILQRSKIILKNWSFQSPWNPLRKLIRNESTMRKTNRIFERLFTSWSSRHTLVLACFLFIEERVSGPV